MPHRLLPGTLLHFPTAPSCHSNLLGYGKTSNRTCAGSHLPQSSPDTPVATVGMRIVGVAMVGMGMVGMGIVGMGIVGVAMVGMLTTAMAKQQLLIFFPSIHTAHTPKYPTETVCSERATLDDFWIVLS